MTTDFNGLTTIDTTRLVDAALTARLIKAKRQNLDSFAFLGQTRSEPAPARIRHRLRGLELRSYSEEITRSRIRGLIHSILEQ